MCIGSIGRTFRTAGSVQYCIPDTLQYVYINNGIDKDSVVTFMSMCLPQMFHIMYMYICIYVYILYVCIYLYVQTQLLVFGSYIL